MTEEPETTHLINAVSLLEGIIERTGIDATVVGEETEDRLVIRIDCEADEDLQRIIGRRGHGVDAFQHLLNKMLGRDHEDRVKPVLVDAGGYRERHVERLETLAQRMADKCKETGNNVYLDPMSAYDRRIVHMYIAEVDGISTRSEGEDERRRIVVCPHSA